MKSLKSYRELTVWKKSIDLSIQIYRLTSSFPTEEKFGIISQMRRAATSIPANIAEGQARRTTGEFLQSLGIARGSLAELEIFLIISERLQLATATDCNSLLRDCEEISKMLNGLMKALTKR
uniref:four helix bundle protein n=1 Tax=Cyclonatronum proteinivorum TaxID=1457365 RepID=UPI000E0F9C42|nr:four helix bundle protein [Cyclonatronum proteinivorum]